MHSGNPEPDPDPRPANAASGQAGADLMALSRGKAALLAALFLFPLVLLDRAILHVGNALSPTSNWKQGVLSSLARVEDQGYYILGTCQTAVQFDSRLIGEKSGSRVFNAGVFATGMAFMDFTTDVLLSHHKKGTVVFVINEGMLEESRTLLEEIERHMSMSFLLDAEHERALRLRYGMHPIAFRSGFLEFRGQGYDLLRAAMKIKSGNLRSPSLDGYVPRPANQNIMQDFSEEYLRGIRRERPFNPSPWAVSRVEGMLERSIAGGLRPIIVIAPSHKWRTTEELNRQLEFLLESLARKYHAGFLSYLEDGVISGNPAIWCTDGLTDRLGSEAFSAIFAADLNKLAGKTP